MGAVAISTAGHFGPADRGAAHERSGEPPLRLTRRGRAVLVLLAVAVLLLAALVGVAVASGPGEPTEVRVHVVSSGETLWELARGVAAPGEDLRDVVGALVELNGLDSSGLDAGQKIVLPVARG